MNIGNTCNCHTNINKENVNIKTVDMASIFVVYEELFFKNKK